MRWVAVCLFLSAVSVLVAREAGLFTASVVFILSVAVVHLSARVVKLTHAISCTLQALTRLANVLAAQHQTTDPVWPLNNTELKSNGAATGVDWQ